VKMKQIFRDGILGASTALVVLAISGCATPGKTGAGAAGAGAPPSGGLLEGMRVVEQPELEPDWADFVKDYYPNWRAHYWVDRGQWGNRGYLLGKPITETEPAVAAEITPLPPAQPAIVEEAPPRAAEPSTTASTYTVKKGDSLWRIAGKVYGNPLKWPLIYRANKDKIKNPNLIYPNQVLTIP